MKSTIRKGVEADYPEILNLIKAFSLQQGTPEKVTTNLEQMLKEQSLFNCFVAASETGEVVAFASYFYVYYSWSGKALYLDDLFVKEDFREQGIGKMLLDEVVAVAKTQSCKKLRWQVAKWNARAIDFYKKMGASIDDVELNCDLIL